MFNLIANDTAGQTALSRFFTSNTWNAQQIFKSPSTTVAGAVFQSSGTVSAIPAGYGASNLVAQFIAEESSAFPYTVFEHTGNSQGHILAFRASRGTYASRTAVQNGDILGQLDFGGHNSSSLVNGKGAFRAYASQTWTTTANGTRLECWVTPNGSTTNQQILVMESGLVYSLTALQGFASVRASASAGTVRDFRLSTNAVNRWQITATATAETGSNVGSDFTIDAYTDAGGFNFNALTISRSAGNAVFYNLVTAPQLRISLSNPPASATATGSAGQIRWDANYIYVCTATDTWKRVAIATW